MLTLGISLATLFVIAWITFGVIDYKRLLPTRRDSTWGMQVFFFIESVVVGPVDAIRSVLNQKNN